VRSLILEDRRSGENCGGDRNYGEHNTGDTGKQARPKSFDFDLGHIPLRVLDNPELIPV
jgi:hypothetical protein